MRVVYKYFLSLGLNDIRLSPKDQVLDVQIQDDSLVMWVLQDVDADFTEYRHFEVVGTGHEFVDHGHLHIATVQHGSYVWHIFEVSP